MRVRHDVLPSMGSVSSVSKIVTVCILKTFHLLKK